MATIEFRKRADGTTAYRLKWRYGGKRDGAPQGLTYDDLSDAKSMKGAVEALRHLVYDDDPKVLTFELVTGQKLVTFSGPTLEQAAEKYISGRTRAKESTKRGYRHAVRRVPSLLARAVDGITEDDLRAAITAITDAGGVARSTYEILRSIFRWAHNKGMIPSNPMLDVDAPKKRERTQNFLTVSDAALLVHHCRVLTGSNAAYGPALADLCESILGTGMRISEALGLVVADVHVDDLDAAWIDVELQLSRRNSMGAVLGRIPLKTYASQRRIVLDRPTAELFARLVEGKRPSAPVFPDPVHGGWWDYDSVQWRYEIARDSAMHAGMVKRPRLHDLRHTHAAWLLTDGASLLAVSRRLGHESIQITADIYGHLEAKADDMIRAILSGRRAALSDAVTTAGKPAPATTAVPSGSRGPANRGAATAPATRKTAERTASTGKSRKASADATTSTTRSKGKGSAPAA